MKNASALFFRRVYNHFSGWILFAGWYCNMSLIYVMSSGFGLKRIKVSETEPNSLSENQFLSLNFENLPDRRAQILRLIGSSVFGFALPEAACWSEA
jgi:hypothetical protein